MATSIPATPISGPLPGPRSRSPLGSLGAMRRKGQLRAYVDWWREYGDSYRVRLGPKWLYVFAHPDHVRHIHITHADRYEKGFGYAKFKQLIGNGVLVSEGSTWRKSRQRMQPLFLKGAVLKFLPDIAACVDQMIERWQGPVARGEPLDMYIEMTRLTMAIIARSMLGADFYAQSGPLGRDLKQALEFVAFRTMRYVDLPLYVPTPANVRFRRTIVSIEQQLRAAMQPASDRPPSDFLSSLLAPSADGQRLPDHQVLAEVINVFFAGFETTSLALTWCWHQLAHRPELIEQLAAEADDVLGDDAPTPDSLPELQFARALLLETFRLHPPVWAIVRDAKVDDAIGGFDVPAGTMVLNCQYITHRHPEFWSNPNEFDPTRFASTNRCEAHPQAYFPFGAGARTCLGEHFAMMEGVAILAMLARRLRPKLVDAEPMEPWAAGTLHPRSPVRLKFERR